MSINQLLFSILLVNSAYGDIYMHNPRGSNDRNCERNVNRNNGDRLFNSQNNNAGGYACPRGVGTEDFMNEAGNFTWTDTDGNTYTQTKKMYYYEGSILPIEWTDQHGCGGNTELNCEIILQYACEDTLDPEVDNFWPWTEGKNGATNAGKQHYRSGTNIAAPRDGIPTSDDDAATDTINDTDADATPDTAATRRYAMHENRDYYQLCQRTQRNKGLYTADQQVNREDQRGTRQNPNGNRNGLECPEERDYYPWWHPSPWIDIAVLSDSAQDKPCYATSLFCSKRCQYYFNNTMNRAAKGYCDVNHETESVTRKTNSDAWNNRRWYNNRAQCEGAGFTWYMVSHADNLVFGANSFVCARTQFSRANQLGNAVDDTISSTNTKSSEADKVNKGTASKSLNANRFLWSIPTIPSIKSGRSYFSAGMVSAYKSCTLRIRYNISTGDFQQWDKKAVDSTTSKMVDFRNNTTTQTSKNTPITQNPFIYIGPGRTEAAGSEFVKLKINTNQFGRTFQDRSYTFTIKPLPTSTDTRIEQNNVLDTPLINNPLIYSNIVTGTGKIYNLNARGKRGNIVQVYPSVEYDFVPNQLALAKNDMIHFQWTGSDYNPRRGCNDGTGGPPDANTYNTNANTNQNSRADRHNFMLTGFSAKYTPSDYQGYSTSSTDTYSNKLTTQKQTVPYLGPCDSGALDYTSTEQTDCYKQMVRLAHLNQQEDGMSLFLRDNDKCLTVAQLKAMNTDEADNHPLNCGKLNAKPTPYFDGGLMAMLSDGWYAYFDSRNNNFSNRQVKGVICVGPTCKVDNGTNVLQDPNPQTTGVTVVNNQASTCTSTSTLPGQSVNGVQSCIGSSISLDGETFAGNEGDNDNKGDGTKKAGCAALTYSDGVNTVEEQVVLAIILLFVGLFAAWLAYYLYNRYQAKMAGVSKFRYDAAWQKADHNELAASEPKEGVVAANKKNSELI